MGRRVLRLIRQLRQLVWAAALLACLGIAPSAGVAQPANAAAESGPAWSQLTRAQQESLRPLAREWAGFDANRKEKWLDVARRMPDMAPDKRARIQARMAAWADMSPQERTQARLRYQEAKRLSRQERQAQWEAYQALSPEQKRQLAAKAAPPVPPDDSRSSRRAKNDRVPRDDGGLKSNIVPNPAHAAPPRAVAPSVLQARPGATTTSISRRPAPPAHQQTGLPKIAGTPEFVDKATLLPRRGAQGAAAQRAASAPGRKP